MQALGKHHYPPCASLVLGPRDTAMKDVDNKTPALLKLTFLMRRGRYSIREIDKMYILPDGERTLEENKAGKQDGTVGRLQL